MSRERWDAKIRLLHGPLSSQGDLILHGPVIRIGAHPGPGGLSLHDYRGLDARQAVITTYNGEPQIEPVGSAQVRVAPHEHVDWTRVQALQEPALLTNGCAIHLGRPGRGATFRFVDCQPLGVWEQSRIQVVEDVELPEEVVSQRVISADRGVPKWFVAGLVFIGLGVVAGIAMPLLQSKIQKAESLKPAYWLEAGERIAEIRPEKIEDYPELEGMDGAWEYFVARLNAKQADDLKYRKDTAFWDQRLKTFTSAYMRSVVRVWSFWKRLSEPEVVDAYEYIVLALRDAGMPEAAAGIPYHESQYFRPGYRNSIACAGGWWHFLPEVANRVGMQVKNCSLKDSDELYSARGKVPPPGIYQNAEYLNYDAYQEYQACAADRYDAKTNPTGCTKKKRSTITRRICRIRSCATDDRNNLERSTEGAIELMREAWDDDLVRNSGAAVLITMAAHNGGWDDNVHRKRRGHSNLKGALLRWQKKEGGPDNSFRFLGHQTQCESKDQHTKDSACRKKTFVPPETQHYVYRTLAEHFVAVCYYARNHSDRKVFGEWAKRFDGEKGYCRKLTIPSDADIKNAFAKKRKGGR